MVPEGPPGPRPRAAHRLVSCLVKVAINSSESGDDLQKHDKINIYATIIDCLAIFNRTTMLSPALGVNAVLVIFHLEFRG